MQENYLAKWLNNELSEEELASFKRSEEYASYQKIIAASDTLEGPSFDKNVALNQIHHKINNKETKVVKMRPATYFLRYAAAIAVLFAATYIYIGTLDETIATSYAEHTEVILPDASEVQLNADSKLSYSEKKWESERELSLKGEAFFKVAKGKKFTVNTDLGSVTVLGTQFNVESRKGFFEVTCYEGLVSVQYNGKEEKLPAGTSFLVINGKIFPAGVPSTLAPSWVNNESSFKSIPLSYVFDELQRQYNIKVETKDVDLTQLFTGTFSNTNLNLALQSISAPSQLGFTIEKNKVLFYAETTP